MKVILLGATPPPIGGIATWTLRMMNINPEYGCEYILVDEKMIGGRDMFGNNKRNIVIELKRSLNIWKNLNKKLVETQAEIVQSCIASTTLSMMREIICSIITKLKKKKFIIHFHCTVPNTKDSILWKSLIKILCKMSDRIFVLNLQSEKFLKEITRTEIEIIPNFVEEKEVVFEKKIRKEISKVLYVGGVIESKGVLDIIDTAKLCPNIMFKLVGNPEKNVINYAKDVNNIIITGSMDKNQIKKELKDADIFIFLSKFRGEGFSMALLEAMAAGLPCIVSDWAANKDMIGSGGGSVIQKVTPRKVKKSLEEMASVEIRKNYSQRNINVVKEEYIADIIFKRFITAYSYVIGCEKI